MHTSGEFTRVLKQARHGDAEAVEALYSMAYPRLRRMARRQLRGPGRTLNPTGLVHEAYLKLAGAGHGELSDRRHFMAVAARAMRQIIVDYARARQAGKRGSGAEPVTLEEDGRTAIQIESQAAAIIDLDDALGRLGEVDARLVRVVELRFFAGLQVDEVAEILEVSPPTVKRDTRTARAFLQREIDSAPHPP